MSARCETAQPPATAVARLTCSARTELPASTAACARSCSSCTSLSALTTSVQVPASGWLWSETPSAYHEAVRQQVQVLQSVRKALSIVSSTSAAAN